MSDVLTRLKLARQEYPYQSYQPHELLGAAIDEIERLRAELSHEQKKRPHTFNSIWEEREALRGRVSELESERGKLPYDVVINGGMTFKKGVAIKTFVKAAQRWHRQAMDRYKTIDVKRLRQQASELDP